MNRMFRSLAALALSVGAVGLFAGDVAPARAADTAAKPAGDTAAAKKLHVLLVAGGCCHDYGMQKQILEKGLSARAPVELTVVHEGDGITTQRHSVYEKPDWYKGYDLVIHDECSADVKDLDFINNILKAHDEAGIPAVVLHCGMHNYRSEGWPKTVTPWFEFTGLQTTGHGPQLPIAISFVDKESPITKGLEDWKTINEELYNNIAGNVLPTAHALARGKQVIVDKKTGKERTEDTVVAWTNTYKGKTKVFATTVGHNNATVADARYLNLVARGLLWAAGRSDEFKASDENVDFKSMKADPHPGKKEEKKADAGQGNGPAITPVSIQDGNCCGSVAE